jgi:nitrite reductase/ring-hydroxylating ferredoxin subunit
VPTKLVAIARLKDLPKGKTTLVHHGGERLACYRDASGVHVLQDACPHEGHPLSMGQVREGVLTCPWHNWKFEVGTGTCTFGGESVRRYPSEIHGDEVFILEETTPHERERLYDEISRCLDTRAFSALARVAVRAGAWGQDELFARLVTEVLRRAPRGIPDAIPALEAGRVLLREGLLDLAELMVLIGDALLREPLAPSSLGGARVDVFGREAFLEALLEEQRDVASHIAAQHEGTLTSFHDVYLAPFLALKLWDGGAALVRTRSLLSHMDETAGKVAATRTAAWAVARSDLPNWRVTRAAVAEALRTGARGAPPTELEPREQDTYRDALRSSERRAVRSTLSHLERGVPGAALLRVAVEIARERLNTYDVEWSERAGSSVTLKEPVQALSFAQAASAQAFATPMLAAPLSVLCAGLIGRLSRVCGAPPRRQRPRTATRDEILQVLFDSAIATYDPASALLLAGQAVEGPLDLSAALAEPRLGVRRRDAANVDLAANDRRFRYGID